MSETPWFEAAFRADYLAVYAHRDQASAAGEVAFLVAWVGGCSTSAVARAAT